VSQRSLPGAGRLRLATPMVGRDPSEPYRAATPLELFFDLVFVVAVSLAADRLHVGLAAGRVAGSLVSYGLVFFGIWWTWVNFTWFSSAYDTDDVVYRIFVFVTITSAPRTR
jgi:low temperature requirement protein LtrA